MPKLIGWGFQIELSVGILTFGVECIWYLTSSLRKGRSKYIPYVYVYGGVGLTKDLKSFVSKITKNPALLFNPKKVSKAEASISVFAVFGLKKFKSPSDYEGPFDCASATAWYAKTYTSWSKTCIVVGLGVSTSMFSVSYSRTYYFMDKKIFDSMSKLYNEVSKKAKKLKL